MPSHPQLIVVGGFAGAGKSTLARTLGHDLSIPVFEIDELARTIAASPDFHGERRAAHGVAFDLFFGFARRHLRQGGSLILDQNMGHARTWDNVRALRDDMPGASVTIFILECPYELCVSRVAARAEHPNLAEVTAKNLAAHKYKWYFLQQHPLPDAIWIDAMRDPATVRQAVLRHLDLPPKGDGELG